MAGGYLAYYYNNTAWDVVKPDPEPPGPARWQILKETMESVPYWRMNPVPPLAVGGTCLAEPAATWLCYVESRNERRGRKTIRLNLTDLSGPASAEWINTWTGDRLPSGEVSAGVRAFEHPAAFGDAPAILVIRRK
jgi:hypothetical protein